MDLSRPYTVITSSLDLEVLAVLQRTTRPLTGREVARLASYGSQRGVALALRRLTSHGLVFADEAGSALLYTLNRDHLAAPAVEILTGLRAELERRLREALEGWTVQPFHVSLFGSAARGDGDTSSDIDLFIVRPSNIDEADEVWRRQISELAPSVWSWTGNHLSPSEVSERDLKRLLRQPPPVVRDIREHGISLVGPPPRALFGATR